MMEICLIFCRPDGGVSITHPLEPRNQHETEAAYLDRVEEKLRKKHLAQDGRTCSLVPDDWIRVSVIPTESIPSDRRFRDAWCWEEPCIDIDMNRAREIHLGRIRARRDSALESLDKEQARFRSDASKVFALEQEKIRLRDLPQALSADIQSANTVEALCNIQPFPGETI